MVEYNYAHADDSSIEENKEQVTNAHVNDKL